MSACIICSRNYSDSITQPKVLICGHDFCNRCIRKLYKSNKNKGIVCPTCRRLHEGHPDSISVCYGILRASSTSIGVERSSFEKCGDLTCMQKGVHTCADCLLTLCQAHKYSHVCIGVEEVDFEAEDLKGSLSLSSNPVAFHESDKSRLSLSSSASAADAFQSMRASTSLDTSTDDSSYKKVIYDSAVSRKDPIQCEKVGCSEEALSNISYRSCRRLCRRHYQDDHSQMLSFSNEILQKASVIDTEVDLRISQLGNKEDEYAERLVQLLEIKSLIENKLDDIIVRFQESHLAFDVARSSAMREKKDLCILMRKLKSNLRKGGDDNQEIWESSNKLKHYIEDLENTEFENIKIYSLATDLGQLKLNLSGFVKNISLEEEAFKFGLIPDERSRKDSFTDLKFKTEVCNLSLNEQPWDVAFCSNTEGYRLSRGHISRNPNGKCLPRSFLLVKMFGEYSKIYAYSLDALALIGHLRPRLFDAKARLECLACSNSHQLIFLSDSENSCVHAVNLCGENKGKIGENILKIPRGLTVDEKKDLLLVCDSKKSSVYAFSIENDNDRQKVFVVKDPMLEYVANPSLSPSDSSLWITCSKTHSIAIFHFDGQHYCKSQQIFIQHATDASGPWGICHDRSGRCFVTGDHYLLQLDGRGNQVEAPSFSKLGLSSPKGVAFVDSSGKGKLVVADKNNCRLQIVNV